MFDVIVAGGGPAGPSAVTTPGLALRATLVLDSSTFCCLLGTRPLDGFGGGRNGRTSAGHPLTAASGLWR